ncbi:SFT2-domain-containing protein [Rhizoclosmatium globosum]|uniref:Protein transport protein SFT2 n=1 Tax=Rhizoclosmatium globosum TaxID=329046 RepID=A0A1Y2CWP2_9FUNG|nr:SFT2-domain-containing protein [Rhizoclosmatium globosum]|eukprot:ORY51430.1 SFT2-domain-containing protein [Rhizoclosmatium globosum]
MSSIESAFQESLKNFNNNKSQQQSSSSGLGGLFGGGSSSGSTSGSQGALDSLMGGMRSATQNISSSLGIANREPAEPEFCGLTSFQRFVGFAACFAMACFCFMVSVFSLPLMIISPSKFVTPFTFGSLLAICSFALIKGPRAYIRDAFSKERLAWTVAYFGSLLMTLYFSLFLKSYLLTIVAVVVQVFTLGKFFGSYAPSMSSLSMMSMFGGGGGVALPV